MSLNLHQHHINRDLVCKQKQHSSQAVFSSSSNKENTSMKYWVCKVGWEHYPPPEGKDLREQPTLLWTQMVLFNHGALRWLTMQFQESCSCTHQPMLHKHQKPPPLTVLLVLCGCHLGDVSRLPLPHSHQYNTWSCMGITPWVVWEQLARQKKFGEGFSKPELG